MHCLYKEPVLTFYTVIVFSKAKQHAIPSWVM